MIVIFSVVGDIKSGLFHGSLQSFPAVTFLTVHPSNVPNISTLMGRGISEDLRKRRQEDSPQPRHYQFTVSGSSNTVSNGLA